MGYIDCVVLTNAGSISSITFSFFCRKRSKHQSIRFSDQFQYFTIGYIAVEVHIIPQAFVHVPCRGYSDISCTQFLGFIRCGLDTTTVENLYIHVAEPFAADIKTEYIPAIWIFHLVKGIFSVTWGSDKQYSLNDSMFIVAYFLIDS